MIGIKYTLRVSYGDDYEFDDGKTALKIAEILLLHQDKKEEVTITLTKKPAKAREGGDLDVEE